MSHVSPERLAAHALDQEDPLGPPEERHLAGCPACQAELSALRRVVDLSRQTDAGAVPVPPDDRVWSRIQAQLAEADGTARTPAQLPRRRRRLAAPAAAAAGLLVGAAAGVAGTIGVDRLARPEVEVLASATLVARPGHTGHGTAELVREQGVAELRVRLEAASEPARFHELWLLNADGKRMFSLGVLPPSGAGTYPLPAELGGRLREFTTVDVSVEPYDGNAAHSTDSLVRGTLQA